MWFPTYVTGIDGTLVVLKRDEDTFWKLESSLLSIGGIPDLLERTIVAQDLSNIGARNLATENARKIERA
jgi:hypothetical protein